MSTVGLSFVGRFVLFRSVLYRRFHCINETNHFVLCREVVLFRGFRMHIGAHRKWRCVAFDVLFFIVKNNWTSNFKSNIVLQCPLMNRVCTVRDMDYF